MLLTDDFMDDKELYNRTVEDGLAVNAHFTKLCIDHKTKLEELKDNLNFYPTKLSHDIMVPFGRKALMKGKIVHTNEIMIGLGAQWFIKVSANTAKEVCTRMIQRCDDRLKHLGNEYELLSSRIELPIFNNAFPGEDSKEIIEPFDEEKEKHWRIEHGKKEKEYRKKLKELRSQGTTEIVTQGDLVTRLNELELEEELEDELAKMETDSDNSSNESDYTEDNDEFVENSSNSHFSSSKMEDEDEFQISHKNQSKLIMEEDYRSTNKKVSNLDNLKPISEEGVEIQVDNSAKLKGSNIKRRVRFHNTSTDPSVQDFQNEVNEQKNCVQQIPFNTKQEAINPVSQNLSCTSNISTTGKNTRPAIKQFDVRSKEEPKEVLGGIIERDVSVPMKDCNKDTIDDNKRISKFKRLRQNMNKSS